MKTETHRGMLCDNQGRDWIQAAANQGIQRSPANHQKLERGKDRVFSRFQRGAWPC